MEKSNIIPFKKRSYPKKKRDRIVLDRFEQMGRDVRKMKLKSFMSVIWTDQDSIIYECFSPPVDVGHIISALEIFKQKIIKNIINNTHEE